MDTRYRHCRVRMFHKDQSVSKTKTPGTIEALSLVLFIQPHRHSSCKQYSDVGRQQKLSVLSVHRITPMTKSLNTISRMKVLAFILIEMSRWNKHVGEIQRKISESGSMSSPLNFYFLFFEIVHRLGKFQEMLTFNVDCFCRSPRCDGFSGADLGKLVLRAANYRFREFFRLR